MPWRLFSFQIFVSDIFFHTLAACLSFWKKSVLVAADIYVVVDLRQETQDNLNQI